MAFICSFRFLSSSMRHLMPMLYPNSPTSAIRTKSLSTRRMGQFDFVLCDDEAGERTCVHFSRELLVVLLVAAAITLS